MDIQLVNKTKYAQVTIFIIIGILIFLIVAGFFIVKNRTVENKDGEINPEVMPVNSFVLECIKETGLNAIDFTSMRGGYFITPEKATENDIAYYFIEGQSYMPTKEEIEKQISMHISEMLFLCINEFSNFPDLKVSEGEIKTKTKIEDNKVTFDVIYPLSISKNFKTYSLEKFNAEVPVRLGIVYDSIAYLIEDQVKHPDSSCISCMVYLSQEHDLNIHSFSYNEDAIVISVKDDKSNLNNKSLVFNFANKYSQVKL
jgi:hypothetical protein